MQERFKKLNILLKLILSLLKFLMAELYILGSLIFFSKVCARFFYYLFMPLYLLICSLFKLFKIDIVSYIEKPDLDFMLNTCTEQQQLIKSQQTRQLKILKESYITFLQKWEEIQDGQLLITMDTNPNNPFYEEAFKFLKNYFGIYRIVPEIIPIDNRGIMHLKFQVLERKEDNLSFSELSKSLQLRCINAFNHSDRLLNIATDYWSEFTIYFPDLEQNLENNILIVLVALSKSGTEHIKELRKRETEKSFNNLEETL